MSHADSDTTARQTALAAFLAVDAKAASRHPRDLEAAAAVARLILTPEGPRFDPDSFAELIAFSEEMPF